MAGVIPRNDPTKESSRAHQEDFLFLDKNGILIVMQKRMTATLIGLLVLAGVVFVLNNIAQTYYLYWVYWWYDIMMHFLGGVLIGAIGVWGAFRIHPAMPQVHVLLVTLATIGVVGIGWEVFEYMNGFYIGEKAIVFDTILDLIMDTLGALIAFVILTPFLRGTQRTTSPQSLEPNL